MRYITSTEGEHVCSMCNNMFENEKELADYELPSDGSMYGNSTDNEEQTKVNQHGKSKVLTVDLIRPFKCDLCDLVFDRMSQLDKHKRNVHSQERSQVCQICGKGFFRSTDLKTHLNIHLGTNRCICEVCGREFNHVSNLIRHGRTHSGVKPYPCTICGKRFTQINTLTRHKAIHKRGDDSMDCCFCDKQYKTRNGLKLHMKKSHGFTGSCQQDYGKIVKRKHYCTICGDSFQFVELLKVHESMHQGINILECKSCNQVFQKMDEIKEHRCDKPKLAGANEMISEKIVSDEEFSEKARNQEKIISNLSTEEQSFVTKLEVVDQSSRDSCSERIPRAKGISKMNTIQNSSNHEPDYKFKPTILTCPSNREEDKRTKETIVYVTTEQLANMNTEQVVDTANHFLHEHLMQLAAESALQTDNISSRDCDNEAAVSEMISNCWKEIEIPDVNEPELAEKQDASSKNTTQNIIYVHTLKKDGLAFLNKSGDLGNIGTEIMPEKLQNIKHDLEAIENSTLHAELQETYTFKLRESECVQQHHLVGNKNCSKKISGVKRNPNKLLDSVLFENINLNCSEPSHRQELDTSSVTKGMKVLEIQDSVLYLNEENSDKGQREDGNLQTTLHAQNMFEDLFKNHMDNVNTVITKSSDNQEPTLRLVKTDNEEQFYELLITNCSENEVESCEIGKISEESIHENSKITPNEPISDSLLKLVQLENGQRILELTENTLSEGSDIPEMIGERTGTEDIEEEVQNLSKNVNHDKSAEKSFVHNRGEKIFYLAQSNKDNLIDFFEIETLGTQDQNCDFVSDETIQNLSIQTNFDDLGTLNKNENLEIESPPMGNESCEEIFGLIQNNLPKYNEKIKSESKKAVREDGPMVRLVQNEDGAQFFELIRGDSEFDETQDFELIQTYDTDEGQSTQFVNNIKHAENVHTETSYTMNGTDEKSKLESEVSQKKKPKSNVKKYNCDVCKKSFSKGYNYRQHIGTHFADQQKFKCKECGTLFAWKSTLNKHMASHRAGGQQKFVCEICPKVYTTLSQVNEHVKRDHLKERNHKCTHCSKTFFKKFDLKTHTRTHTKERPYECRICYKSFHYQSHIIRHERIHSGERPYACNICEKTFTQLGSLKNHRQRHQELKIDILDYQMDEDDPLPRSTL
ncbi:uncharacterized protein LOC124301044 isoform X1 [Neodiprion virginianus]|uniref:uncharacterized protein LOC124301044 isoform X1 n=1 Tax=Neodiprion virginianus TaxID=2961670 RepID=UPI001EE76862|nr:uncharacterized protein LOC124301044 isoform X1 [Neodiprion virginianus]XP_046611641.1 uncharacterized protein LOC124301044 isoform X1 [Neodiprion virginianus]